MKKLTIKAIACGLFLAVSMSVSAWAVTTATATKGSGSITGPTFCKENSAVGGEELCFCIDGNCQMVAQTSSSSLKGHYMLCVNSNCLVANDTWEDCIGSNCTVGDNAVADCIKDNSTCSTTRGARNASIICRAGTNCNLSNETDAVYCLKGETCNYAPKNHANVKYVTSAQAIPATYAQEHATYTSSASLRDWLDSAVKGYQTKK